MIQLRRGRVARVFFPAFLCALCGERDAVRVGAEGGGSLSPARPEGYSSLCCAWLLTSRSLALSPPPFISFVCSFLFFAIVCALTRCRRLLLLFCCPHRTSQAANQKTTRERKQQKLVSERAQPKRGLNKTVCSCKPAGTLLSRALSHSRGLCPFFGDLSLPPAPDGGWQAIPPLLPHLRSHDASKTKTLWHPLHPPSHFILFYLFVLVLLFVVFF